MKKKIYIVNGIAQSGKDTFIKHIQNNIPRVGRYSYITPVLDVAKKMGWKGDKSNKGRKFLALLSEAWTEYNDGIFKNVCDKLDASFTVNKPTFDFIIVRNPRDIDKFKSKYKCKTILIEKDKLKVPDNISDRSVGNYNYDIVITNNGTLKQFYSKIDKFITEELGVIHRLNKQRVKPLSKIPRNERGQFTKRSRN